MNDQRQMGPVGVSVDRVEGDIVSGMPSEGHHEVGREVHDHQAHEPKLDTLGMGMDAYRSGKPRDSCPYPPDGEAGRRWLEGWDHQRQAQGY